MSEPSRRLLVPSPQAAMTVYLNGQPVQAFAGETVAGVMLANGRSAFFDPEPPFAPSRLYCNMGTCMQCLLTIDQKPRRRACQTFVAPGMRIKTQP